MLRATWGLLVLTLSMIKSLPVCMVMQSSSDACSNLVYLGVHEILALLGMYLCEACNEKCVLTRRKAEHVLTYKAYM